MSDQVLVVDQSPVHRLWVSLNDRRNAVELTLLQEQKLSDRSVAAKHGVSRELVRRIRIHLVVSGALQDKPSRVGRDGKTYRVRRKPDKKASLPPIPTQQIKTVFYWLTTLQEIIQSKDFMDEYFAADSESRAKIMTAFIRLGSDVDRLRRVSRPG